MGILRVSSSPHLRSSVTTKRIMIDVLIALFPCVIASVVIFGAQSLLVLAVSVVTALMSEYLCCRVMKRKNSVGDMSAAVTGVLLALTLPANIPLYVAALGAVFSVVIVKQLFGGLGNNIFNPALAGRAFMLICFAAQFSNCDPVIQDAVTGATPMAPGYSAGLSYWQLTLGAYPGAMGETCIIAIVLGLVYLLVRRVISYRIPVFMVGASVLTSAIVGRDPIFEILAGGLLFGAIFMATDYVTSPMSKLGQVIYAVLCGVLTILIREFGAYPEGTMFAILIMNAATPLIDKLIRPRVFGEVKAK